MALPCCPRVGLLTADHIGDVCRRKRSQGEDASKARMSMLDVDPPFPC